MQVDVNNGFNSAEDRVQYALGSMDAFSIRIDYAYGASNYAGIVALNHTEALTKFLEHCCSSLPVHDNYSLQVSLCE